MVCARLQGKFMRTEHNIHIRRYGTPILVTLFSIKLNRLALTIRYLGVCKIWLDSIWHLFHLHRNRTFPDIVAFFYHKSLHRSRSTMGRCNITRYSLRWRHNGRDGVWNHQPHDCLLNRLFGCRSKKASKLSVTGLCVGNSPGTGELPAQMASNAENVSIWCRHHVVSAEVD